MKTSLNSPNLGLTKERIKFADFQMVFKHLWGGTKLSLDYHSLRRGKERFFSFMSFDLLASNIADALSNETLEDYILFEQEMGSKFAVLDEASALVIFGAIGDYNNETGLNDCFIHSVFKYDKGKWDQSIVFVEEGSYQYKVCKNGEVICNPPEMRTSYKKA